MDRTLFSKLALIGLLSLVITGILGAISGVIDDREMHRSVARQSIVTAWAGDQTVIGPLLVLDIEKSIQNTRMNPHLKSKEHFQTVHSTKLVLAPETLTVDASTAVEQRYRGIYSFPVYTTQVTLQGTFKLSDELLYSLKKTTRIKRQSQLEIAISDPRGFATAIEAQWNRDKVKTLPGVDKFSSTDGVHASIDTSSLQSGASIPFLISMQVKGLETFQVAAIGKDSTITIEADWAHPKFIGGFLPSVRTISTSRFGASWKLNYFATGLTQSLENCQETTCNFYPQTVGVELFEPIDLYHLSERSLKYGVLFIVLTFASFFLFEIITSLLIHPIQYGFVGAMQSVFYLLLLSLSEHSSFLVAYTVATIACIMVITIYLSAVLRSWRNASRYATGFAMLYGVLYFVLRSQDFALLLGTFVLFSVLATLMLLTRNVDWYALRAKGKKAIAGSETATE